MAKQPKPFWISKLRCWYVQLGKKQIRLASDEKEAWAKYYQIMADRKPEQSDDTVVWLFEKFLSWAEANTAPGNYKLHVRVLSGFVKHVGKRKRIADLRAHHATAWLDDTYPRGRCNDTTRSMMVRTLKRAFNWGFKQGYLAVSPLAQMETPPAAGRDAYLDPDQWETFEAAVRDRGEMEFLDVILMLRYSKESAATLMPPRRRSQAP